MESSIDQSQSSVTDPLLHSCVDGRLYLGMPDPSSDFLQFLADEDITIIVDLSPPDVGDPGEDDYYVDDVEYYDHVLTDQELLVTEIPTMIERLESIATSLQPYLENDRGVLVSSIDRNRAALVVGYYLITRRKWDYQRTIEHLEYILMKREHYEELMALLQNNHRLRETNQPDVAQTVKRLADLDHLRCLTLSSFRSVLRRVGRANE